METAQSAVHDRLEQVAEEYHGPEGHPIGGYAAVIATYAAATAALLAAAKATDRLPTRVPAADLALFGVAAHKLARTVTKDSVTTPLRAPFTEYRGQGGPAELMERPRRGARGWRRAVGELASCPFCAGQWISTGFVFGSLFAPRATRTVASIFAIRAAADWLHFGYAAIERLAEGPSH